MSNETVQNRVTNCGGMQWVQECTEGNGSLPQTCAMFTSGSCLWNLRSTRANEQQIGVIE